MSYLSYSDLYPLDEFSMIAGTEYNLEYTVYQADGISPVDLSSATVTLLVSPYGNADFNVIQKAGTLGIPTGTFSFVLTFDDTKSLSGKFIQQPVITDFYGKEYRLGQGVFTILPKIASE